MKKFRNQKILAIDTSCDETSVAVLEGRKVLSSVVSSQVELHKKWGGVVPDVARRAHLEEIEPSFNEALKRSGQKIEDIEAIAVTIGPGLAIDLEVGIDFAKDLAIKYKKPFIPINHMEGHLLSGLLLNSKGNGSCQQDESEKLLPALGMLISGKHTEIVYIKEWGNYEKLGQTLDDAAGEAFDKVGRMLNFGYPGGPIVSEMAKRAPKKEKFGLPVPMEKSGDLNFSYSGLKTACLYRIKELNEDGRKEKDWVFDFCNEFVDVVTKSVLIKVQKAIRDYPDVKTVLTGGGVYNNEVLSRRLGALVRNEERRYILPEIRFRSDNAAMIGIAGLRMLGDGKFVVDNSKINEIERIPRYSIDELS